MIISRNGANLVALSIVAAQFCFAEPPSQVSGDGAELKTRSQVVESLPVRVVDSRGEPVRGAIVEPWAIRSGQGHYMWPNGEHDRTEVSPEEVDTDVQGNARIAYPRFTLLDEGVRTIGVSISVDHRDYACPEPMHIEVPLDNDEPYVVVLEDAVPIELRPMIDGKPTEASNLYAFWSGVRSGKSGFTLERTASTLRLPPLKPGSQSVLVAKMDGDRVTHFSRIVDFEVPRDGEFAMDVPLSKVAPIEGALSDNVPRPVTAGRIKVQTVPPHDSETRRVSWSTWVPIRADGTFTLDAWPIDEKVQLIALCDGFIASSGEAPLEYEGPDVNSYLLPQVFDSVALSPITVQMVPLVECVVKMIDEESQPVAGVTVESCPNVGWWNGGAQIYCAPLYKTERFLKYRRSETSIDRALPQPFRTSSDRNGIAKLELPEGKRSLWILSGAYELPIHLGARRARTELVSGETSEVTMLMQAKGTEQLSDWDSLAGVVFGCSTREGRRILALPGVSEKMEEFTERFREAKAKDDPELLAGAYAVVAGAFADIEDFGEAARWYEKASQQQQENVRTDD